jgi:hypothetical protein
MERKGSGISAHGKTTQGVRPTKEKKQAMIEQRFPPGWDEKRVQQLLAELDSRTDDEWIAADEAAAAEDEDQTVVTVPMALLPEVRRLLGRYKPA